MKDVSELKLLRTKKISLKKQQKIKKRMNIMFIIGFLIPTINAIYQQVIIDSENQKYINVMFIFILLDIIVYLPIFLINRDPYSKGKNKLSLLILLQIRNLLKLMLAIYSLIYFFITMNISFNNLFTDFIGSMKLFLSHGLSLSFTVVSTLFTLICGNTNRRFKKELFDAKFTVSTYERDEETKDIIMKTYINKIDRKAYFLKSFGFNLLNLAFVALVFFFILYFLK